MKDICWWLSGESNKSWGHWDKSGGSVFALVLWWESLGQFLSFIFQKEKKKGGGGGLWCGVKF